jgi:nanoRNase/pAp phosphatase (c-di-AMP/oligoRNAs hydrolase)
MQNSSAAKVITEKIHNADSILVLASNPIDFDCIGTTLAARWWFLKLGKKVDAATFNTIPENIQNFPDLKLINAKYPDQVNFETYDLILLLDGNSFRQFFTKEYKKVLKDIDIKKIIGIDHHIADEIGDELGESYLSIQDCCTAKVFFDNFIEPSGINLDPNVAQYLYMALVGDTGGFKHQILKDTFAFAQKLIEAGADHYKATDWSVPKDTIDFMAVAIQHTEYFPEIQTTILTITKETLEKFDKIFQENWENRDLLMYYKNAFMTFAKGYPYAVIFISDRNNNHTKISWRKKSINADLDIMEIFKSAGFVAKGHKNAGGGTINATAEEAQQKFTTAMRSVMI